MSGQSSRQSLSYNSLIDRPIMIYGSSNFKNFYNNSYLTKQNLYGYKKSGWNVKRLTYDIEIEILYKVYCSDILIANVIVKHKHTFNETFYSHYPIGDDNLHYQFNNWWENNYSQLNQKDAMNIKMMYPKATSVEVSSIFMTGYVHE